MTQATKPSMLRAISWKRPAKRRYIEAIERGLKQLEDAANDHSHPIRRLLDNSPLIHGTHEHSDRQRRMRSDGVRNLLSLMQAMLAGADLMTGILATPLGASWDLHSWGRLDHRAFGERVKNERGFRRTQRHGSTLCALGFVKVTEQKTLQESGQWRSAVAIKHLTAEFYRAIGLTAAVSRARRERDSAKGVARIAVLKPLLGTRKPRQVTPLPTASGRAPGAICKPLTTDPPPITPDLCERAGRTPTATESIARLKAMFSRVS